MANIEWPKEANMDCRRIRGLLCSHIVLHHRQCLDLGDTRYV